MEGETDMMQTDIADGNVYCVQHGKGNQLAALLTAQFDWWLVVNSVKGYERAESGEANVEGGQEPGKVKVEPREHPLVVDGQGEVGQKVGRDPDRSVHVVLVCLQYALTENNVE